MPVGFMGEGEGRSGYETFILTGRLLPSMTFLCTTAWKPRGPSIGVSSGSSKGALGGAGESVLRDFRAEGFRDTTPVDEGDVPSE